jgi:Tfp pilus assembly protein FimV
MSALFTRWLRCRADDVLRRENERLAAVAADLRSELDKAQRTIKVQEAELAELAAVVARNIKRVEAETAAAARQIADSEKGQ